MNVAHPDSVLMVFCKAPIPGQVKTRLMPELTAEQAADLHAELSLGALKIATESALCPVQLWCAPATDHPFFSAAAVSFPVALRQQQGLDLGERMDHAFRSALTEHACALLIGCDCPSLTRQDLQDTLRLLGSGSDLDVVLAPAEDGGYALIGLKRPCPELFAGIPWGTADVLELTHQRIERLRLRYREINRQWDLDTPRDLHRYRQLTANGSNNRS